MGFFSASTLAEAAIGPLPGGAVAEAFAPRPLGYRATFYISSAVMFLVGFYAYILISQF